MQRTGIWMAAVGVALSGCASQRSAQEMNQLKSDVGLLDQRVSQLERASLKQPASAPSWSGEAPTASSSAETAPPAAATPAPAKHARSHAMKPSKTEIQHALKNAGLYQGPIDGKLGPQTRDAIRQFQQANGLKVDGVVGRHTWEKLSPYLEQPAASAPAASATATTTATPEASAAEPVK